MPVSTRSFVIAAILSSVSPEVIALTQLQQTCDRVRNHQLQLVVSSVGKDILSCVKRYNRDRISDIQACVDTPSSSLSRTEASAESTLNNDCSSIFSQSSLFTPIDTLLGSARSAAQASLDSMYGPGLSGALRRSENKDASRCQETVLKRVLRCQKTQFKEFNRCKKFALEIPALAGQALVDEVQACVLADPRGKIERTCGRVGDTLQKRCVEAGVDLAAAFVHCGSSDPAVVEACLREPVRCGGCETLNANDGLGANCDLLDDGLVEGSCFGGVVPNLTCSVSTFFDGDGIFRTIGLGQHESAFSGGVIMNCGGIDPNTQEATCQCDVGAFSPESIGPLGILCAEPAAACGTGVIRCAGGDGVDVTSTTEHFLGICTSQSDCAAQCGATCTAGDSVESACEHFCLGGSNEDAACSSDDDCPGGRCPGAVIPLTTPHGNACNCTCESLGGPASPPGGFSCPLGVHFTLETSLPCGDGDVTADFGDMCMTLTTGNASAVINDAFLLGGPPVTSSALSGVPLSCDNLVAGDPTGLRLVGVDVAVDAPGTPNLPRLDSLVELELDCR